MNKRRRTAVVLALVGIVSAQCAAGYLLADWLPWLTRDPVPPPRGALPPLIGGNSPRSDDFVGHTEASIVARFGPPTRRWKGHFANPPIDYKRAYPEAIAVIYQRPTGTHYLSYCREKGRLTCFTSHWMPTGCVF